MSSPVPREPSCQPLAAGRINRLPVRRSFLFPRCWRKPVRLAKTLRGPCSFRPTPFCDTDLTPTLAAELAQL